ncbi:long-chain fatty acid--CoA ligase [Arthrobacter sp. CDRTa11]|nr:long-chain fatty acid--CoA ligase [Arthrobacter sp. CDRTa11]
MTDPTEKGTRRPLAPQRDAGIGGWATRRAITHPDVSALIYDGSHVTYRELLDRSTAVAHHLAGLGVCPGDRVAYAGRNEPAFVYTMLGTHLLGAIFVPLNFRLAPRELDYVLQHSEATVLIYAPESAASVQESVAAGELAKRQALVAVTDAAPDGSDFASWLESGFQRYFDVPISRDDTAFILYTSGTTGRPKGATLSHDNVYWNCLNLFATLDITSREVALVSSPLFHVAALTQTLLPVLLKGATAVLMPAWDTEECFDLIQDHAITWMFGVPTMYAAMEQSARWKNTNLSSLRLLTAAGAPIPPSIIASYQKRGFLFCQGYGLTETAPGATFLEASASRRKVGSAGLALPFTQVRCVTKDGRDVLPGERGEILIKGPNVMKGYWNDTKATKESFTDDGWFRSGDIAVTDDEGYIYIVDRLKDMFISGGENIYPSEVEAALYEHPAVQDAAVVGTPDEKWGEVGKAFISPAAGQHTSSQELRQFLASRLAKYKIPVYFEFLDDLPKTGSGKVRKDILRER